jgi:hypothetical protein
MNEQLKELRTVSNRLVWALATLVAVGIPGAFYAELSGDSVATALAVFFVGFTGGFVGLQRRLKTFPPSDLTLLANSWVCLALSPMAGGILAVLIYLLFVSGLLQGDLFPAFDVDKSEAAKHGLQTIFAVHCRLPADYAKVLFWSFIAGFSEKFATNVISGFESQGSGPEQKKAAE